MRTIKISKIKKLVNFLFIGVVELRKQGIQKFLVDVGAEYLTLFFEQVIKSLSIYNKMLFELIYYHSWIKYLFFEIQLSIGNTFINHS